MKARLVIDRVLRIRHLTDPVFGRIRYQKAGFWEGTIFFKPVDSQVEVLIRSSERGPTAGQREFIAVLETRYREVLALAIARLRGDLRLQQRSGGFVSDDLKLECINLPLVSEQPEPLGQWDLSFVHTPDGCHCLVDFQEWQPVSTIVEPC